MPNNVVANVGSKVGGHIVGHTKSAAMTFGASLGGAAAGIGGLAVGVGLTALIAFIDKKIALHKTKKAYTNIKCDAEKVYAWQTALEARVGQMPLEEAFKQFLIDNAGVQGDKQGKNPTIPPFCIDLFNAFQDKAIKGAFLKESGAIVDIFDSMMFGILGYLLLHKAIVYNGDTNGYRFNVDQIDQGTAAMLMFGNELSIYLLRLSQVCNSITTNEQQRQEKRALADKIVESIHITIRQALGKNGLLNEKRTKFGEIVKGVASKLFGYQSGRVMSLDNIISSVVEPKRDEHDTPLPSIFEKIKDRMLLEASLKEDEAIASELVRSAYEAKNKSYIGMVMATQNDDPIGPAVPVEIYREFKKPAEAVLTKKARKLVDITENRGFLLAERRAYNDKNTIVAMPSGQADFTPVGDLNRQTKASLKSRSAKYVTKEHATQSMQVWRDITYLRGVIEQISAAYSEEVRHGSGAKSPIAHYFLLMLNQALNQVQLLYAKLAGDDFLTQMINRTKHHYVNEHQLDLSAKKSEVSIGLPHELGAIREVSVDGFYNLAPEMTSENAEKGRSLNNRRTNNLDEIRRLPSSTFASALRKDAAWHVYMQQHIQNLLQDHEKWPEADIQTVLDNIDQWSALSERAKAWSLTASVLLNDDDQLSKDAGYQAFRQDTKDWREAFNDIPNEVEQRDLIAISKKHKSVMASYTAVIKNSQETITDINNLLQALYNDKNDLYRVLIKDLMQIAKDNLAIQSTTNEDGCISLQLETYRLIDAYDYHHIIDNLLTMSVVIRSQSEVPTATKEVLDTNARNLRDLTDQLPKLNETEKETILRQKTEEASNSLKQLLAQVEDLTSSVSSLKAKNTDLLAHNIQLTERLAGIESAFAQQLESILKTLDPENPLLGKSGDLLKALQDSLESGKNLLAEKIKTAKDTVKSFQEQSLKTIKALLEEQASLVKTALDNNSGRDQDLLGINTVIEAELDKVKSKKITVLEDDSLRKKINEMIISRPSDSEKIESDLDAYVRGVVEKHLDSQIEALANIKSAVEKCLQKSPGYLAAINACAPNYDNHKKTYEELVDLSKVTMDTLKQAEVTNDGKIADLEAQVANLQMEAEKAKWREKMIDDQLIKMKSIFASQLKTYQEYDRLSIRKADNSMPTARMGKLGQSAHNAAPVGIARGHKSDKIRKQLDILANALDKLMIHKKSGELASFNAKAITSEAMNALVSAFLVAHVHRKRFLPEWAGIAKSAKSLAEIVVPKKNESVKKFALISKLIAHVRFLEDKFEEAFPNVKYQSAGSLRLLKTWAKYDPKNVPADKLTTYQMARIMKDIVRLQYQVANHGDTNFYHNGKAIPLFTGGYHQDFDWDGLITKIQYPKVQPTNDLANGAEKDDIVTADRVDPEDVNQEDDKAGFSPGH